MLIHELDKLRKTIDAIALMAKSKCLRGDDARAEKETLEIIAGQARLLVGQLEVAITNASRDIIHEDELF
jgi:hypothetical protein